MTSSPPEIVLEKLKADSKGVLGLCPAKENGNQRLAGNAADERRD
jgi:hypothetical protein